MSPFVIFKFRLSVFLGRCNQNGLTFYNLHGRHCSSQGMYLLDILFVYSAHSHREAPDCTGSSARSTG